MRASLLRRGTVVPAEYDEAYRFWKQHWLEAIAEQGLHLLRVDVSDVFVNADAVLVLRVGGEIGALGLVSALDLGLEADRDVAYLEPLPREGRELLAERGVRRIVFSSQNCVRKDLRRSSAGAAALSLLLPGFVLAWFERHTEFDLCMGLPLLARGNHRILEALGMRDMHAEQIQIYGVDAKFMYALRGELTLGPHEAVLRGLVDQVLEEERAAGFSSRAPRVPRA